MPGKAAGAASTLSPLVGRAAEVQRLTAALTQAARGHGGALFLTGEAGIGKTRLAQEALALAGARRFRALHGRAFPIEGGLAYAPILDAFGPFLRHLDPARFDHNLRRGEPAAQDIHRIPDDAEIAGASHRNHLAKASRFCRQAVNATARPRPESNGCAKFSESLPVQGVDTERQVLIQGGSGRSLRISTTPGAPGSRPWAVSMGSSPRYGWITGPSQFGSCARPSNEAAAAWPPCCHWVVGEGGAYRHRRPTYGVTCPWTSGMS